VLGVVGVDLGVADLDLGVADVDLGVGDLDLGVADLDLWVEDLDPGVAGLDPSGVEDLDPGVGDLDPLGLATTAPWKLSQELRYHEKRLYPNSLSHPAHRPFRALDTSNGWRSAQSDQVCCAAQCGTCNCTQLCTTCAQLH
jgi:hypothetical protein